MIPPPWVPSPEERFLVKSYLCLPVRLARLPVAVGDPLEGREALEAHRHTVTYRLKNKATFLYNGETYFISFELPSSLSS